MLQSWPRSFQTTNQTVGINNPHNHITLQMKTCGCALPSSPCCERPTTGCCFCPAHLPVHRSHTRINCHQMSGSNYQTSSSSCPLLPPPPPTPRLRHSLHCGKVLRRSSGQSLGQGITGLVWSFSEVEKLTWLTAPVAPPSPPSPIPPVWWWRATSWICFLKKQT